MRIIQLAQEHESELADFLSEFSSAGEEHIPGYFAEEGWTHADVVDRLGRWSRGEGLREGWVPCTTLFLEDAGRLLGLANIRHRLSDYLERHGGNVGYSVRPSERGKGHATRLLEASKDFARSLGMERILVTCSPENPASARVIAKCGGILEDESYFEPAGEIVRRFWIAL